MTSKAAITTSEIGKNFTAGHPTRASMHAHPDFRLKRFGTTVSAFGAASQCAEAGGGGTVYGTGFKT